MAASLGARLRGGRGVSGPSPTVAFLPARRTDPVLFADPVSRLSLFRALRIKPVGSRRVLVARSRVINGLGRDDGQCRSPKE